MLKSLRQKISPLALLVGSLLILLAALATLQYRWLGRVSAGEREMMQANLKVKVRAFCAEFDGEITRAYPFFKMNADELKSKDRNESYASRYDKWLAAAPRAEIVKNVFLAEAGDDGRFHLLRFDRAARAFVPTEWTGELDALRRRFEQTANPESPDKVRFYGDTDSVVEEIPALVSSIVPYKKDEAGNNRKAPDWLHPLGYIIVALDLDYIKKDFIPALTKAHFSSGAAIDYDLTVISRTNPKKIIYKSASEGDSANDELRAADASDKILSLSFDKVKSYSSSEVIFDPPQTQNRDKPSSFTLVIQSLKDEKDDAVKVSLVNDSGKWEVKVNHRAGSLDAAVADARQWNLAASFGILLLLGGSVVLIAVLSRRSQRLARRQIEFVAGVSHEFRTPLAVIYSLSENLAAGRIKDSRQVERYGATIHKDVRRLTEMVEQVLEFAGAERNGKHFYDKNPVDVGNLVEKVLTANFSQFNEEGWIVETEIEPDSPLALADEAALERAVQNLIGNVMKYCDGNRWLKVTVHQNRGEGEVNISVEDKGIGIPQTELRHVFEPFYRGREAVNAQIHGSGIGLSLVKQIIEAHGGRVSVKSSHGENGNGRGGSTFTLHLPVISE